MMKAATFLTLAIFLSLHAAPAQERVKRELRANHAPAELIKKTLGDTLSPSGNFIILPNKGTVVVIDTEERVIAASKALAAMEVPTPDVAVSFAFRGGVAGGSGGAKIVDAREFIFPVAWDPARIIVSGRTGQPLVVIPATPTKFTKRNVGQTLETTPIVSPDGTVALDINYENTQLDGFINYGSGIFTPGSTGIVPVNGRVPNPTFFTPFLNNGGISVPIFSTTRVSTSIILRPAISDDLVTLDMIPQVTVHQDEDEDTPEDVTVNLTDFRTEASVRNNQVGKVNGFKGASAAFNRAFIGVDDDLEGGTAIMIKPHVSAGEVKAEEDTEGAETPQKTIDPAN